MINRLLAKSFTLYLVACCIIIILCTILGILIDPVLQSIVTFFRTIKSNTLELFAIFPTKGWRNVWENYKLKVKMENK